jgi:predicted DNA-binding transcriptional regulator AlpA
VDIKLLRDREVAEMLSISVASVWRYARTGKIPDPIKVGYSTRWLEEELKAYLRERDDV